MEKLWMFLGISFVILVCVTFAAILVYQHICYRRITAKMTPEERKTYDQEIIVIAREW